MVNTKLLEDAIQQSGYKKGFLAEQVAMSRTSFNNCCNNRAEFRISQANKLGDLLGLTMDRRVAIFFSPDGV